VIEQVILPPYYNSAINLNINLDTWQSLSPAAQDIIMQAVIAAEEASEALMQAEWEKEVALYEDAGVEIFVFQGEDAERYLEASRIGILTEFERSGFDEETTNELLALFAD
jgi:TRAP-type C4-dicarboxylate transport system substrate-binding protein